jgi:hypothetical protein
VTGKQPGVNDQSGAEGDLPRDIGSPALRALVAAGYTRLEQLDGVSAATLGKLHGVGPKALGLLSAALAARGLSLAP